MFKMQERDQSSDDSSPSEDEETPKKKVPKSKKKGKKNKKKSKNKKAKKGSKEKAEDEDPEKEKNKETIRSAQKANSKQHSATIFIIIKTTIINNSCHIYIYHAQLFLWPVQAISNLTKKIKVCNTRRDAASGWFGAQPSISVNLINCNLVEAFPMRSANIRREIQKDLDKTVQALSDARSKLQTALEAGSKDHSACSSRFPSLDPSHSWHHHYK